MGKGMPLPVEILNYAATPSPPICIGLQCREAHIEFSTYISPTFGHLETALKHDSKTSLITPLWFFEGCIAKLPEVEHRACHDRDRYRDAKSGRPLPGFRRLRVAHIREEAA